ncbi:MAG: hypothetical protein ABID04_03935 [Patescibacteria group bacterium]
MRLPGSQYYSKQILPLILILAACCLFLFWFVPNQLGGIGDANKEAKKTSAEIKDLKDKYVLLSSLDQQQLVDQSELCLLAVPEEKDIYHILQALNGALSSHSFLVKTMKLAPGEVGVNLPATVAKDKDKKVASNKSILEKMPIEATFVGPYEKAIDLLIYLEKTLPLFETESLEIAGARVPGAPVTLKTRMVTFFSPAKANFNPDTIRLEDLVLTETESELLSRLASFRQTQARKLLPGEIPGGGKENPFSF